MIVSSVLIADEVDQDLSCEAVLVRDALAYRGLETPLLETNLSADQKYQRIKGFWFVEDQSPRAFFAQRPQMQERLTAQIQTALQVLLQTEDVAVAIDATHYCVKSRGLMDTGSTTSTCALGGCFSAGTHMRAELLR
jgi:hypothetical protein